MKKKIIILGTIASILPLAFVASCGSTWSQWKNNENQLDSEQDPIVTNHEPTKTNSISGGNAGNQNVVLQPNNEQWKMRDLATLKSEAFDATTNTIEISKLKNQFELNRLLADVVGLKSPHPLEYYWQHDKWSEFKSFISSISDTLTIKIQYSQKSGTVKSSDIKWDITNSKSKILTTLDDGIEFYKQNQPPYQPVDLAKYHEFYLENAALGYVDLNENKLSGGALNKVANIAAPLTYIPTVTALTDVDGDYAGEKLALLVNLPKDTFDAFGDFLTEIDYFTSAVYGQEGKSKNESINLWFAENSIDKNINLKKRQSDSKISKESKELCIGAFVLQALSTDYDL